MRKLTLVIIFLLLFMMACAHKPSTNPNNENDYLKALCHRVADYGWESAVDGVSNYEMHEKLGIMLRSLNDER
jgi:hypothetical protein